MSFLFFRNPKECQCQDLTPSGLEWEKEGSSFEMSRLGPFSLRVLRKSWPDNIINPVVVLQLWSWFCQSQPRLLIELKHLLKHPLNISRKDITSKVIIKASSELIYDFLTCYYESQEWKKSWKLRADNRQNLAFCISNPKRQRWADKFALPSKVQQKTVLTLVHDLM